MGDCGPWGGAGEELLGATLDGTAGRRPNRGCGPRAAAEATRHNVTKPHRPRTYRDAGRERALGAAGRSTRQAGASTSRRHGPWTRMESRASSGPEEKYDTGAVMRTSDGRSSRRFIYVPQVTHINHLFGREEHTAEGYSSCDSTEPVLTALLRSPSSAA